MLNFYLPLAYFVRKGKISGLLDKERNHDGALERKGKIGEPEGEATSRLTKGSMRGRTGKPVLPLSPFYLFTRREEGTRKTARKAKRQESKKGLIL